MKQCILLIEESVAIRYLLRTLFYKKYRLISNADCYLAANELREKRIDLIIVGIDAVQSANFDFLAHLHSSSFYMDIPKIVLSASPLPQLRATCLKLGVDGYFVKPFNPLALGEMVEDILHISQRTE